MVRRMRVLVAGDRGYIGAVLVPMLHAGRPRGRRPRRRLVRRLRLRAAAGRLRVAHRRHPRPAARGPRRLRRRRQPGRDLQRPGRPPQPRGDLLGQRPRSCAPGAGRPRRRRAALRLLLVVQPVRRRGRRGGHRGERLQPGHAVRPEQGDGRAADQRSSPTRASARPTCATPRRTARARGCARTSSSTTSPEPRSPAARCGCRATARRGVRWSTPRTSRGPSSPCSSADRRGHPRPGVQRRSRRGRRPDPHHRRRGRGADRRARHVRRGRLGRQARLPGRLRQDRSPAARASSRPGRCPAGIDQLAADMGRNGLTARAVRAHLRAAGADQPPQGRRPPGRAAPDQPCRASARADRERQEHARERRPGSLSSSSRTTAPTSSPRAWSRSATAGPTASSSPTSWWSTTPPTTPPPRSRRRSTDCRSSVVQLLENVGYAAGSQRGCGGARQPAA